MIKRAVGILSIAAVPVFVAAIAFADDRYGSGVEHGATSGTSAGASSSGFIGQHMMTGTVKDIDKDEGTVKLDAEGHELELHFPQSALRNVSKGDRVTVQMALKKASSGSGTSGAGAGTHGGSRGSEGSGGRMR